MNNEITSQTPAEREPRVGTNINSAQPEYRMPKAPPPPPPSPEYIARIEELEQALTSLADAADQEGSMYLDPHVDQARAALARQEPKP